MNARDGIDEASLREQAAGWVVDRDALRPAEVETAFAAWAAQPGHRAVFDDAQALWDDIDKLPRNNWPVRRRAWRPAAAWAVAASILVMVLTSWLLAGPKAYETGVGGREVVHLADGSTVTLNTGTRLRVEYSRGARRIELDRGEALFDVAADRARPFVVAGAGRSVTALGTAFVVRREPVALTVTLLHGKVAVASDGGIEAPITLAPGDRVAFRSGGQASRDRPQLDAVTAWQRGEVIFRETPVAQAVAEMNRYTRVPIELHAATGDRRLNGIFKTAEAPGFARLVARLYGWRLDETSQRLRLDGNG